MSDEFQGVSAELGAAGPCPVVTYKGKPWSIGWPTQRAKATLENLVFLIAKRNVEQLKSVMPPHEFAIEQAALSSMIRGGKYRTWGPLWVEVNNGPDGNTLFLLSLLRENHPEATFADAEGMWAESTDDVQTALAQVIPGFFKLLVAAAPGTPEQKAEILARSVAEFLSNLHLPPGAGASNAPTTS